MPGRATQVGKGEPSELRSNKRIPGHYDDVKLRRGRKCLIAGSTIRSRPVDEGCCNGNVTDAAWKIASIVRSARFFTDGELVNLYKSQLLSYFECRTAAIYHACDTVLAPLNQFQNRFLRELGISVENALPLQLGASTKQTRYGHAGVTS